MTHHDDRTDDQPLPAADRFPFRRPLPTARPFPMTAKEMREQEHARAMFALLKPLYNWLAPNRPPLPPLGPFPATAKERRQQERARAQFALFCGLYNLVVLRKGWCGQSRGRGR